jgi:hypothetical protein
MVDKLGKNIFGTIVKAVPITLVAVAIATLLNMLLTAITANAPAEYVSAVSLITAGILLMSAMAIHKGPENFLMLVPYMLFIMAIYGVISMTVTLPEMIVNITTAAGVAVTASVVLLAIEITDRILKAMGIKL